METKNTAPKWGTMEWIKTYRLSTMDRKRRKRAFDAIRKHDEGAYRVLARQDGAMTPRLAECFHCVVNGFGIELGRKNAIELSKAVHKVAVFEDAIFDEAFGRALAKAWGLE